MENELFGLSLNEEGMAELVRFNKRARAIFIASLVLTIVNFVSVVSRVTAIFEVFRYTSRAFSAQVVVTLGYLAFTLVIIPIQWYYYLAFSRTMQESISGQDNIRFNRSFRLLNSHAVICFLAILANILYFAYVYYSNFMLRGKF